MSQPPSHGHLPEGSRVADGWWLCRLIRCDRLLPSLRSPSFSSLSGIPTGLTFSVSLLSSEFPKGPPQLCSLSVTSAEMTRLTASWGSLQNIYPHYFLAAWVGCKFSESSIPLPFYFLVLQSTSVFSHSYCKQKEESRPCLKYFPYKPPKINVQFQIYKFCIPQGTRREFGQAHWCRRRVTFLLSSFITPFLSEAWLDVELISIFPLTDHSQQSWFSLIYTSKATQPLVINCYQTAPDS